MFPRICLPLIVTGSAVTANLMLLVAMVLVFVCIGHLPGMTVLSLPLVVFLNIALALGFGLTMGVLNVFMRDVGQVVPVLLQVGYWFTPIVYLPQIIPEPYRNWLALNPLYPLVGAYQDILVFGRMPSFASLAPVCLLAVCMLGIALYLFRRSNAEMVDVL
jgi:lipopolysaccharide transport system permease protein